MCFVIIIKDKDGVLQVCLDICLDYIVYFKDIGVVEMVGFFLNEDGQMYGSLIVIDVVDYDVVCVWVENDFYVKVGLFEKVCIEVWNKVIG